MTAYWGQIKNKPFPEPIFCRYTPRLEPRTRTAVLRPALVHIQTPEDEPAPELNIVKIIEGFKGYDDKIYYKVLFSNGIKETYHSPELKATYGSLVADYLESKIETY